MLRLKPTEMLDSQLKLRKFATQDLLFGVATALLFVFRIDTERERSTLSALNAGSLPLKSASACAFVWVT